MCFVIGYILSKNQIISFDQGSRKWIATLSDKMTYVGQIKF